MKYDRCEYCGGEVRTRRVTVDYRRGDLLAIFHNVPVGVCRECGERYYPGRTLETLDELAQHALDGAETRTIATLDYANVA